MTKHFPILLLAGAMALSASAKQPKQPQEPATYAPVDLRYELSGGAGKYDYAPSFIVNKHGTIFGFLCENRDPFEIIDYIYLYKGVPRKDGTVAWQPGIEVLTPGGSGAWDSNHVCDPDVRRYRTRYHGKNYEYIMTYLGVDQWYNHNQIGLAVSPTIEGPWTKVDINPIVPYPGLDKWGTGQSTSIVLNDSTINIFYHSTTENGPFCMREMDLRDLDHPKVGDEVTFPSKRGNTYPAVTDDYIFVVVEDRSPEYDRSDIPTWVGDLCIVKYKPREKGFISDESDWIELGRITPAESGYPRNHNPGFLTDDRGNLIVDENGMLTVYFTVSEMGPDWISSYDLYSAKFPVPTKKQSK